MFGAHNGISGGLHNAIAEAEALAMDCVQLFTKNQRQWAVPPLSSEQVAQFHAAVRQMGWADQPQRLVCHNSYLINLAAPDGLTRERSLVLQRNELERCEALGIPLLVSHPGAHLGRAPRAGESLPLMGDWGGDERVGLQRIVAALDRLHDELPGYRTMTCLEATAGAGSNLGYRFEHLAFVREQVRAPERVGFCIDTCHLHAAGYDLVDEAATSATLACFDQVCGLAALAVLHLNDAACERGSRKDRHAHIGHGQIPLAGFRALVNHPRMSAIPKIIETPKESAENGEHWDAINLRTLRSLVGPQLT